jgi:glutathione transport system permease protein
MAAFLVRRIALAFVTLFTVLTLVFVIVRILPGDPAQLILGDQATREAIEAMHVRLGLDQPILLQYATFLGNALLGDWACPWSPDSRCSPRSSTSCRGR